MNAGNHTQIWAIVKELLFQHDCVIIPGFGGFVGNHEPARLDQITHIILPPGKRVVFNQNIKTNDGLLAGRMAEKLSITYAEASLQIESFVTSLIDLLQDKKQLNIDTFGSFRLNAEANYVFQPDKQNSFLYSSYGLQPVQAAYVSAPYARIKRTRIFKERKEVKKVTGKTVRSPWPAITAATLALLLMVNGWIFLKDHRLSDLHIGSASLNVTSWFDSIFIHTPEPVEVKQAPAIVEVDTALAQHQETKDLAAVLETDSSAMTTDSVVVTAEPIQVTFDLESFGNALAASRTVWFVPSMPLEEPIDTTVQQAFQPLEPEPVAVETSMHAYYIIGGVFCKERNAVHFKKLLEQKGYHAEIVLNSSIHCQRVSYASFSSRNEAEKMLSEIKSTENAEAWLYQAD